MNVRDRRSEFVPMEFYLSFRSSALSPVNYSHRTHVRELLFFDIITRRRNARVHEAQVQNVQLLFQLKSVIVPVDH